MAELDEDTLHHQLRRWVVLEAMPDDIGRCGGSGSGGYDEQTNDERRHARTRTLR